MLCCITRNNIFDFALKVFLLICPLAYIGGTPAKDVQLQFFIIGVMTLLGLSLIAEPRRIYSNIWIGLFLLCTILNVMAYKLHPKVIGGATPIFLGILLFYLIITYADNVQSYVNWLLLFIPLNFVMVILQLTGYDFINDKIGGICGLMMSPSHLGTLMVLLIPLALIKKRWLVIPALFCIIASKSITPMIGLAGALGFYYWHKKRPKFLIASFVIFAITIPIILNTYAYAKLKLLGRLEIWEQTLQWAFTKPLYGMGLNSFPEIARTMESWQGLWEVPQNIYLGVLFALGIPALVIVFCYLSNLYKRAKPYLNNPKVLPFAASIVGLLIIAVGQSSLLFARIFVPAIFILVFLEIKLKEVVNEI